MKINISIVNILSGMRGDNPYDTGALENLLVRLSQLLASFPSIQEIDINPVIVSTRGRGARAVDARVVIAEVNGEAKRKGPMGAGLSGG